MGVEDDEVGRTDGDSRSRPVRRRRPGPWRRALLVPVGLLLAAVVAWWFTVRMPGTSAVAPLAPLAPLEAAYVPGLRRHTEHLGTTIGERHTGRPDALERAADWIAEELRAAGWEPRDETFEAGGVTCRNVVAERRGTERPDEVLVVGAHYDTARGTPGANDNGTGVAVLLALARTLAATAPRATLRLVAFANEEPPWFQTDAMGSVVHARGCRERGEDVVAMISLETMGCYLDQPGTQRYPPPLSLFYPDRGDFLAVVGGVGSGGLVRRVTARMRELGSLPVEGAALPLSMPGVGWSDHWSFAREGYPAVMLTDTAPFRYPHYHRAGDTPAEIDYEDLARATHAVHVVLLDLLVLGPGD